MRNGARKWATFVLRWGIAVAGIWWVVAHMSLRDKVTILDDSLRPVDVELAQPAAETARSFTILDPATGQPRRIARLDTVNRPDRSNLWIAARSQKQKSLVLALDLSDDLKRVRRVLIQDPASGRGQWISPDQVAGGYRLEVPRPRVDVGVLALASQASAPWLWAAVLIFPVTFIICSIRWNFLLAALDIHLRQSRTFVINMVGAFYNTFMPGSTGGDVLKAYYASKQTPHRAWAVISVFVDRVVGLLSLVIMGGTMAAVAYGTAADRSDPAAQACLRVAMGAVVILGATMLGLLLFREPVRRAIGLDYVLRKLPMQKHIEHLIHSLRTYRRRPGLMVWSIIFTFPVHMTVVISALFSGIAFGLKMPPMYYFVVVPVIVLSGALPIAPQGAGVMEFFAIQLTKQHGITVSQAFALTMSIRMVQVLWNLTGGIFVLRGGYHAPTESEKKEMEQDEAEEADRLKNDEMRMTNDE
jgi:uncharacterized protein (TIRG00374 family)